jgi:hypothetical protein
MSYERPAGRCFAKGALGVSPRIPGPHKVQIDLVDANHMVFPGRSKTVTFTVPPRSN